MMFLRIWDLWLDLSRPTDEWVYIGAYTPHSKILFTLLDR